MKGALAVMILMLFAGCAEKTEGKAAASVDEKDFKPLAERFLSALKSEKIEDAMTCWAPVDRVKALMEDPQADLPGSARPRIGLVIRDLQKNEKDLKERFPAVIKQLKAEGADPAKLTLAAAEGTVDEKGDLTTTSRVTMTFETPDGMVGQVSVDDGIRLDGTWYFTDKLDLVTVKKKAEE
jgi:hypothetical protein